MEIAVIGLVDNAALLMAIALFYDILLQKSPTQLTNQSRPALLTGLGLSLIGIALMLNPWHFRSGIFFDTRSILISLTGLYFGPLPGILTASIMSLFRYYQGGAGYIPGIIVIWATLGIGLAWRRWRPLGWRWPELYLFGLLVHLVTLALMLTFPRETAITLLSVISLPILIVYPVGTVLLGMLLNRQQTRYEEIQSTIAQAEQLRQIVQDMPVMLDAFDANGTIVAWNKECEKVTGYSAEEMVNNPIALNLLYSDSQIHQALSGSITGNLTDIRDQEWALTCKDGRQKTISWSSISRGFPIPGWITWAVGVDVTGRVQAHQALQQSEEQLRLALDALQKLNAELEKRVQQRTIELESANHSLESFTYSVSHDLKAPLRGIEGYSKLIVEDYEAVLDENGRFFLRNILQATQQMNQLVDDLLAFSHIERQTLLTAVINPRILIATLLAERKVELDTRQISVTMHVVETAVSVDPNGLTLIMRNLLDNAIKFTRKIPNPTIDIGGEPTPQGYKLWIQDNGIGFDMRFHDRIFDIFQRLHLPEEYPGTGIGLAIVHKAVVRLGGKIRADSAPGCGATFYLELPSHPPAEEPTNQAMTAI
ncbi:MAG: PAS domain S-box protein [Chloroflexi bacterium]|nr:PAS domain S-box protein [Chloroflexota bacterium]MBP7041795.1 PAS domain S-box protein [Chloroflexota bacterium]